MSKDLHLENIRREYTSLSLSRKDLPADPLEIVSTWIDQAIEAKVNEPTAVIVGTATPEGRPSMRTVLLKEVLEGRFVFYSNYDSRKGKQIAANPHVALTFLWHEFERQIHIEGTIERLPAAESDAYFAMRPYKSRVGARISPQSQPIPSREYIMMRFAAESLRFVGREVPRPENWGGFTVTPSRIELWQGRDSRLHDRFLYELQEDGTWSLERLAP
jgi:pyridoxamine 5'-phosphate oxidase